ncbi:MAG: acyl-CoA dehydrogenase C-terminal domain-containing protein [Pirellulales bacterium]
MASYKAPRRDMRFVYYELHDGNSLSQLPGYEEATPDLVDAIIDEAAKVAENVLHPLNRSGDEEGCTFAEGTVHTPAGFKEAYSTFAQGGWTGLGADPQYGGQGMPGSLGILVSEMLLSANLSLAMYPGLAEGVCHAMDAHSSDELKQKFLPQLIDGTWGGTMCLTEPHCGTDLGLIRTKATPQEDGTYLVSGTKSFISAGEHDLNENIIHLVLARLPDAPAGIKGITMFLVPKLSIHDDGSLGSPNGVECSGIEHKMGIKGSSTCVMNFDDAVGYLVGVPHKGMRAMFTMMNSARLGVGLQGLALAEASYQGAVEYAHERLQGRALTGSRTPTKPADPILVHPDVRKMLLTIRAYTEGSRALSMWAAQEIDLSHKHPDPRRRRDADDLASLLTPVVKAFQTDVGFECTNLGLQVFGGHGYIREHGMEQYVRDARIGIIYEGTNGIQALDLVGRKLAAHTGRYLRSFFHPVQNFLLEHAENGDLEEFIQPLAKAFGRLQRATGHIAQQGLKNPNEAGAAATDYLRLFGLVAFAYLWTRMAKISLEKLDDDKTGFYAAKVATAQFYMQRILPQSSAAFATLMAGSETIMSFPDDAF